MTRLLGILSKHTTSTPTNKQEAPQCDETRFSMIQPRIDVTVIRNEKWQ